MKKKNLRDAVKGMTAEQISMLPPELVEQILRDIAAEMQATPTTPTKLLTEEQALALANEWISAAKRSAEEA